MQPVAVIKLPLPPAKRQKRVLQPLHNHPEPAAGTADTESTVQVEVHAAGDTAEEAEAPGALPNDTLTALHLLNSRFPPEARAAPFATRAQLYSLVADRTTVDRQLEELRRRNLVRLMQLPVGRDEYAVMLTSDYCAALRRCKAEASATAAASSATTAAAASSVAAMTAAAAVSPGPEAVFDWFAERVLPACTEVMITHVELVQLLGGSGGGSSSSVQSEGRGGSNAGTCGGPGKQPQQRPQQQPRPQQQQQKRVAVTDRHVSLLLNQGFLTRHTGGADGYLFSMPNAGAAVRSVAAGRQEILSLLQRRRHPEQLESDLLKRKLQRSVLGVRWHVADMVGGGALLRIATTVGPLLRVTRRGG